MNKKIERIIKRVEKLRTVRQQWTSYLEDIYDYSMPNRNTFTKKTEGTKRDNQVFDSTAVIATSTYVSRIQTLLVKPWAQWFDLVAGNDIPEESKKAINTELEGFSKIIYNELNYSNFSEQISSSFYDLAASTGALMVRADDRPGTPSSLIFESIPISTLMIDTASDGQIRTVFRDITCPVSHIKGKWPKAKLTKKLNDLLVDDPDADVSVVEGVIYDEMKLNYNFVLFEQGEEEEDFLIDEKIDESPYIIFRENVTPGETYGRGRLMTVLGDIKSANKVMEYTLQAAAMSIAGVYTAVSDGIFNVNTARFQPGAIIPVASNGSSNPTLQPLSSSSDLNVANFELTALRSNINTVLLTMPLGDVNEVKGRTATEMSIRQNDFMQTSMSGFNRLQSELMNALITKVVVILKKQGKIEDIEINGKEVQVKYTSPIAAMAGEEKLRQLRVFMETMTLMPEQVSQTMIDYSVLPQEVLDMLNLPEKYIRSKEEQKKIVETGMQMQREAMEAGQKPQGM